MTFLSGCTKVHVEYTEHAENHTVKVHEDSGDQAAILPNNHKVAVYALPGYD